MEICIRSLTYQQVTSTKNATLLIVGNVQHFLKERRKINDNQMEENAYYVANPFGVRGFFSHLLSA